MDENVLGTRLAELRGDRKWNQAELGRQLGVSRSHISRIESGETKNVSGELLVKIAKLFKVSTDYLLGITREPSPMNHDTWMRRTWQGRRRKKRRSSQRRIS